MIMDTLAETIGTVTSDALATKTDLAEVKAEIRTEIARLKADISDLKAELLKWLIGAMGLQTLVITGVVVTLSRIGGR